MKYLKIAGKKLAHEVNRFWKDESGMGTVEVILIIVENYTSLYRCIPCISYSV